ncbi:hypothetical protein B0T26DRAFT_280526 [Lasiosphaeria miniovina]|uniref:Uncharacterized protein n=1 Tax=Lasiosphaeria miniovina TaxID=1954250 RepID=A0AA40AJP0_9PEZI|nr:uncharacterized protein B0T26DRAFT_280526 [Lasiosphaeria miniovina]KAK0717092.1 hypothetical protein B0T26DRAFT_280526 [Lasiosphaeria miniovina]
MRRRRHQSKDGVAGGMYDKVGGGGGEDGFGGATATGQRDMAWAEEPSAAAATAPYGDGGAGKYGYNAALSGGAASEDSRTEFSVSVMSSVGSGPPPEMGVVASTTPLIMPPANTAASVSAVSGGGRSRSSSLVSGAGGGAAAQYYSSHPLSVSPEPSPGPAAVMFPPSPASTAVGPAVPSGYRTSEYAMSAPYNGGGERDPLAPGRS